MFQKYLCLFFIYLSVFKVLGQSQQVKISASYNEALPAVIIDDLSKKSGIQIFYKREDLPSVPRTFQFEEKYLELALIDVLGRGNLVPMWYRHYAIVILDKTALEREKLAAYYESVQQLLNEKPSSQNNTVTIGNFSSLSASGKASLSIQVKEKESNEAIIGATIALDKKNVAATDVYGRSTITLSPGNHVIEVHYIGYQSKITNINVLSDGQIDIILSKETIDLEEVTVTAIAKDASVNEVQVGIARIDIKNLDRMPTILGEKDVVRAILINPGVSTIGEGASGFNVRGGNVDQNLVMQDEAILFNASHALGFFSTFNADLIKDASLSKGNLPAAHGGRIASSLEVNMKDGNKEKLRYKASVNPISATLSMDGPLSPKSTITFGARTTYSDYIFKFFRNQAIKTSEASFYDINGKYTYKDNGNTYSISLYTSNDNFEYNRKFGFRYGTSFAQLSWNKLYNNSFSNKLSLVASRFVSDQLDFAPQLESVLNTGIDYIRLVDKITFVTKKSKVEMGFSSTLYKTNPGTISPYNNESFAPVKSLEKEKGIESAIFTEWQYKLSELLEASMGVRLNHYAALGSKTVYTYENNNITTASITGSSVLTGVLKSYLVPEPRLSMKLMLTKQASFKAGYARTSQYINQIFNADTPTPTSQWQLANTYIKPHLSDNFSCGIFRNFNNNLFETSVEVYYRKINRLYDYRDFASLNVNPHIETELLEGRGLSQGVELSLKKNEGKFNGWLSYTYSRSMQQVNGINNGKWYSSSYDKPHNLSLIFNYQPILRHTMTINFTYSTGRPSTGPLSNYLSPDNIYIPIYSLRNEIRIPDYHRLDLSYNIAKSHNRKAKFATSWTFTLYNVYARRNPFSVYYTRGFNNIPQANRLSVVGTVLPAIRFNIEFL